MSHATILIAEDNRRDSDDIASAAQQTGTTVRVYSFTDLMETLKGPARFDLLILDLRMAGTEPHNTVEAVKLAIDRLNLPVIVSPQGVGLRSVVKLRPKVEVSELPVVAR
jgi:CheY-like chemotaxis protein